MQELHLLFSLFFIHQHTPQTTNTSHRTNYNYSNCKQRKKTQKCKNANANRGEGIKKSRNYRKRKYANALKKAPPTKQNSEETKH